MAPAASIIIRCYNERDYIGKLLYGIFNQSFDSFEVILVDSGSTDGTLEVASEYPIKKVVQLPPEKFSFGRALNYGCEHAQGEYCVFISAHCYPKRTNWLEKLLNKFEEDVALVYGKQRGGNSTKFSEKQIFRRWFPDEDIVYQQSPFANNANTAVRREIWEEFPYDEDLTGLEDLDWAKRVKEAGYEISYSSEAEIIHIHDETKYEIYNRYRREAIAYKQIIPNQKFNFKNFMIGFIANTISDYYSAYKQSIFLENIFNIPTFRFLQFWGTYRGFKRDENVSEKLRKRFYYPDVTGYPDNDGPADQGSGSKIDYSALPDHHVEE